MILRQDDRRVDFSQFQNFHQYLNLVSEIFERVNKTVNTGSCAFDLKGFILSTGT